MRRIGGCFKVSKLRECSLKTGAWIAVLATLAISSSTARGADWESIFSALSLPAGTHQKVLAGQFVVESIQSASERELAVAMVFLIKTNPERIAKSLLGGIAIADDARAHSYGAVTRLSATEDLSKVSLNAAQVQRWWKARPGDDINLSRSEFNLLQDELVAKQGGGPDPKQVKEAVREVLVARTRDYQISGLDGIRPYLRKHGHLRKGAEELRTATIASREIGIFSAGFYDLLLGYPSNRLPGFRESFFWTNEQSQNGAVICLTHRFVVPQGPGFAAVQRQFYVTAGYNVEQALALLLPVEEGTLVVYTNRTSTDQVAGFGGQLRRKIGDDLMGRTLEQLYQDIANDLSQGD